LEQAAQGSGGVNKGIFLFCISPRTILREESASACDGCTMQRQTFDVAEPGAAASSYCWTSVVAFAFVLAEEG